MNPAQGVVLFPSVHSALKAEKLTKGKGFSVKLIPVPRHLSSDCGVCLRIPWEDKGPIQQTLIEAGVPIETVHPLSSS